MLSSVNAHALSTQVHNAAQKATANSTGSVEQGKQQFMQVPVLAFKSNLNAVSFSGIQAVTKQLESLRDKPIDNEGIVKTEQLPSYVMTKMNLPESERIQNIVDLTTTDIKIKPFDENQFSPFKPHYIVQMPDGYEGMFKFSNLEGDICREVGARYLSKLIGMDDVVPETMWVKVNTPDYGERVGSLQKMVPNAKSVAEDHRLVKTVKASETAINELRSVILFNYIANNIDTGIGNWLVSDTSDGVSVRSIDHALTGSNKAIFKGIAHYFPELKEIKITESERKTIQDFVDKKEQYKPLLDRFYNTEATERIFRTAEKLLEEGSVVIG